MSTLEVHHIDIEERTLRNERRVEHGNDGMTRFYYGICGSGSLTIAHGLSIAIAPHTLVIVPPAAKVLPHSLGPARDDRATLSGDARILCGRFRAAFGDVVDVFGGLSVPIVERFAEGDDFQTKLRLAFVEVHGRQPGSATMTSSLMKQAIVLLLRRSLTSPGTWVERFAMLRDHRIARAFSEMVAKPGAAHTSDSLARAACLSRSTFMARFYELVGRAPMSVLRDLRMRQAARQLRVTGISIGHIGEAAGYANNSGFIRAFRKAYGMDPRDYRNQALVPAEEASLPVFESDPPKESRSC
jgi:AraC-like DNA-binding protein